MPRRKKDKEEKWEVRSNYPEDVWKAEPADMYTLNDASDKPDNAKEQIIFIKQTSKGIYFVDADKLKLVKGTTMHMLAWKDKDEKCEAKDRPVFGLSHRKGVLQNNSTTFNAQEEALDGRTRDKVDMDVLGFVDAILNPPPPPVLK